MMRRWCLGVFFVCLATSALLARQGIVKTNDGRTFKGDVSEDGPDPSAVSVTIHAVSLSIPRTSIASIDYSSDADQLQNRLAQIPAGDIKARLRLAQVAIDEGQFDVANQAVNDVQKIDPNSEEAQTLLNTIAGQRALQERKNAPARTMPEPVAAAPSTSPSTVAGNFLTMDDVYAIRAAELQRDDTVRVQFLKDVRKRYLAQTGANADEFGKLSESAQALEIISTGDSTFTKDVKIVSDPLALRTFRTRIQPRLLAGCAASGCHGGEAAGGFYLYPNAEQTLPAYTNYYILQMSTRKIEGGDTYGQGPVSRAMIDRLHPENSLILQFGLPGNIATLPHSKDVAWKPIYRNTQDPRYLETLKWIGSLRAIAPDYGIQFDIPAMKPPATQPSTQNAAPASPAPTQIPSEAFPSKSPVDNSSQSAPPVTPAAPASQSTSQSASQPG